MNLGMGKYSVDNDYCITVVDVLCSIDSHKCGKACGPDLSLLFSMLASHCYIPQDLIMTTIVTMLKNKTGDLEDVNNCRAISLAKRISKLFESVILNSFQSCNNRRICISLPASMGTLLQLVALCLKV